VPDKNAAPKQYTSKDFDDDLDFGHDDFDEGLTLPDINTEPMYINIGPCHPATHGTFRVYCKLDGELIEKAGVDVGYLHRGFEKIVETKQYGQVIPYTDRLNYCSGLVNNVAYCKAMERMLDLEVPDRTQYIRVLVMEIQRIMDHMICVGTNIVDIGALTNFWYFFNAREKLNDVIEALTGARLTYSYVRIGGLAWDLPDGWKESVKATLKEIPKAIKDVTGLVKKNRIFQDRTMGVGMISTEDAVSYGWTGPCLRSTGSDHDLRKVRPYYHYDEVDFDIPVGTNGDCYDRYLVRVEEMRQSTRIIRQCVDWLRANPGIVITENHKVAPPRREEIKADMEGLIHHFKLFTEGYTLPAGEVYTAIEHPKGEFGVFLISDGANKPYRLKVRAPGFAHLSSMNEMAQGHMLADVVAIIGTQDIVFGEIDR